MVATHSEGGLFPHPVITPFIEMAPSERYGVVIDFSRYPIGTKIVIENVLDNVPGDPFDPDKTRPVMRFDVMAGAAPRSSVPRDLVPLPDIRPGQAVVTRSFAFARNGGSGPSTRSPSRKADNGGRPGWQVDLEGLVGHPSQACQQAGVGCQQAGIGAKKHLP